MFQSARFLRAHLNRYVVKRRHHRFILVMFFHPFPQYAIHLAIDFQFYANFFFCSLLHSCIIFYLITYLSSISFHKQLIMGNKFYKLIMYIYSVLAIRKRFFLFYCWLWTGRAFFPPLRMLGNGI